MSANYPKSRNDPANYPVYRVAFADSTSFTNDQRAWIGVGVYSMCALGPTFLWHHDPSEADVVFRHWRDDNSVNAEPVKSDGACRNAGQFTRMGDGAPDVIELDPVGLHGELQWIEAAAHEIGHFLGLEHRDGRSPAIMRSALDGVTLDDFDGMHGTTPPAGPTIVDFDEFDRVVKTVGLPVPRK
jgi:hypothetical protein